MSRGRPVSTLPRRSTGPSWPPGRPCFRCSASTRPTRETDRHDPQDRHNVPKVVAPGWPGDHDFRKVVPIMSEPTGERAADIMLVDGSTACVRQIRPDDADKIVDLHSRLSERTRYLRYFSPYPRISPRDLRHFVNVDHRNREAFVVELDEELLAVGRYDRLGEGSSEAEVAFVVADAYQ